MKIFHENTWMSTCPCRTASSRGDPPKRSLHTTNVLFEFAGASSIRSQLFYTSNQNDWLKAEYLQSTSALRSSKVKTMLLCPSEAAKCWRWFYQEQSGLWIACNLLQFKVSNQGSSTVVVCSISRDSIFHQSDNFFWVTRRSCLQMHGEDQLEFNLPVNIIAIHIKQFVPANFVDVLW